MQRGSFVADVVVLSAAVMSGFKGEAIVNDGSEEKGRDQELQDPKEAIFHVVVWVFG
jgi:hypothetical protein